MLRFDNESRRVVREGVPNEVNPFDVLAVSAVAELKQHAEIEAVVYTMGPPQAADALVQCLAMGMDRAVHLVDRAFAGSDTLATARALSLALRRESFDLILCGRNSVDAETGQVGPEVAEMLGIATGYRRAAAGAGRAVGRGRGRAGDGRGPRAAAVSPARAAHRNRGCRAGDVPTPGRGGGRARRANRAADPPRTSRTTPRCSARKARRPGSATFIPRSRTGRPS